MEQMKTQQNTFELSKQLVAIIQQRFQLNSATDLEVREAQKSFEEAGFRLLNVQYIAKVAEIELQRICNNLNKVMVEKVKSKKTTILNFKF